MTYINDTSLAVVKLDVVSFCMSYGFYEFTNSNWFLLCRHNGDNGSQDTTARTANERFSRKINRERCKWRDGEFVPCLNESPLRASSRKPSRLRERRLWKEAEDGWRIERSDIVSVKVGWSDTRDKCPPGVTHQENLRDSSTLVSPRATPSHRPHGFFYSRSPTIIANDVFDNCRYSVQVEGMRDDNFSLSLSHLDDSFTSAIDRAFNNTVSTTICRDRTDGDRIAFTTLRRMLKASTLTHREIGDH